MAQIIRVLHVLGNLNAGGAESRIMDIYRNIDRSKVQFDFAIHTSEKCFFTEEVKNLGARIFLLPKFRGMNYISYNRVWKQILNNNSDISIIHGHMTTTAFIYLNIAKKRGIRIRVAHARNSRKDSLVKSIFCRLSRYYATDLIGVSKDSAISEFGVKLFKNRVSVYPNMVDYEKYKFSYRDRQKTRKKMGLSDYEIVILHVGNFHKQKNHLYLIDIFHEFLKFNSNAKLVLVGSGPLQSKVKKKVNSLDIEESVLFLGETSGISSILSSSDIMVFPSLYEGLPGSLIEAQVNGLPIVASASITREVLISEYVHFLNLKDSKLIWVEKMKKMISIDLNKRLDIIVDNKYDIKKSLYKYYALYQIQN